MQKIVVCSLLLCLYQMTYSQDSLNMTKLANLAGMPGPEYTDIWGYTDNQGREYAIIGSSAAINIVDVTDCSNPVLDSSYVDGSVVIWRDFKTYSHYLYAVCDGGPCTEGLEVINLNTGDYINYTNRFITAHNIYLEEAEGRLYVVGGNTNDIIIYDVAADPWNPVFLKKIDLNTLGPGNPGYIHDVYVRGNKAYASHGYSGFVVYDLTDVNNPVSYYTGNNPDVQKYNHSSWLDDSGQYSYVAFEVSQVNNNFPNLPISIYKVNADYSTTKLGSYAAPIINNIAGTNRPHNPFVKGDSLYISYYHDGVQVWNIDDKEEPYIVGYYDTYPSNTNYVGYEGVWGIYPYFESGCIVASDISTGLYTFKMLEPKVESRAPVVFDNASIGLVIKDSNGISKRITVNNSGEFVITPYTPTSTSISSQLVGSDLDFNNASNSFIFKSPNGTYYKMNVNSQNSVTASQVFLPTQRITTMNDIEIPDLDNGAYLYNTANRKVRLIIDNANKVRAIGHPW